MIPWTSRCTSRHAYTQCWSWAEQSHWVGTYKGVSLPNTCCICTCIVHADCLSNKLLQKKEKNFWIQRDFVPEIFIHQIPSLVPIRDTYLICSVCNFLSRFQRYSYLNWLPVVWIDQTQLTPRQGVATPSGAWNIYIATQIGGENLDFSRVFLIGPAEVVWWEKKKKLQWKMLWNCPFKARVRVSTRAWRWGPGTRTRQKMIILNTMASNSHPDQ